MLLRSLPAFATAESAIRDAFTAKWGRENFVVLGRARQAQFGPCVHTLSIRAAWGGEEHCYVDGRTLAVDDDNFLILNNGRVYATRIDSAEPVESFWICFRPGLVERAHGAMVAPLATALADGHEVPERTTEFNENLQPHDRGISSILRFIKAHLQNGLDEEEWYEEQLLFLLERMLEHRDQVLQYVDRLQFVRASTRREVYRRIGLATDFMHSNYARVKDLNAVARAAYLSKYHFLRLFTLIHGMTPFWYLQRKRLAVALRLLQSTDQTVDEIASAVGLTHRQTFARHLRHLTGFTPIEIRMRCREGKPIPQLLGASPGPYPWSTTGASEVAAEEGDRNL